MALTLPFLHTTQRPLSQPVTDLPKRHLGALDEIYARIDEDLTER
jgi:hypothetical protein